MAERVTLASLTNVFHWLLILAPSSFTLASPNRPARVPRAQAINGCAYVTASDLGSNAACSLDYCNCGGTAAPLLTSIIAGSTTLNCQYTSQPTSNNCPTTGGPAPAPTPTSKVSSPTSATLCIYYTASLNPVCNGNNYCLCGESGYIQPPLTTTIEGKVTTNCDYSVLTTSNVCPAAAGNTATLTGKSDSTARTVNTGPITTATPAPTLNVPIVNSPIVLPQMTSSCTSGDTRTITYTTAFPRAVGYQAIGGGANELYWWNETGAVWVLAVESPGYEIQSLGLFDSGSPWPSQYTSAIHEGPESSQFTISVPSVDCFATQPEISWSVEPIETVSPMPFSYTLSISGEYPCASASHTIPKAPECSHNPDFDLTQENWIDANVDQLLYEWWFEYPDDECNLTALGAPGLKNLSPPNTSNNLASELAYWAANLNGFDCTIAAGTKSCTFDTDPCQYPGIPRWAYLALNAMANLQNNFINIDTALFKSAVTNGFISDTVLTQFKKTPATTPDFLAQVAMILIGAIMTVIGVFIPVAIPVLAVAEEAAIAAEEEAVNLAKVAVARIGEAFTSPVKHAAKASPIYGIIPGTLVSGATGTWSKIASAKTNALSAYTSYQNMLNLNWVESQQTLENLNDNLFGNSSWAAMLMTSIFGGIYVAKPTYSNTALIDAMTTDTTSRMINNIWQQYSTYVQFTNLNDDANGTKCKQDTHGPTSSRFCADGGVYYVQSANVDADQTTSYVGVQKPFGYDHLVELQPPIQPWWISAASSKVYHQYHMSFDYTDADAFSDSIGVLIASTDNVASLIGQLPGEWTLPVCDGGSNYYGYNWLAGPNPETDITYGYTPEGRVTYHLPHQWIPCACGFQGNETVLFYNMTRIPPHVSMSSIVDSCQRTMSLNNNQGFLGVSGGLPKNNEIEMWPGHTLTMTPQPEKPTTSPVRYV